MPRASLGVSLDHEDALILAYQSYLRDYLAPRERDAHAPPCTSGSARRAPGRALWVELEAAPSRARNVPSRRPITAHVRFDDGEVRALEIARTSTIPSIQPIRADLQLEARAATLVSRARAGVLRVLERAGPGVLQPSDVRTRRLGETGIRFPS